MNARKAWNIFALVLIAAGLLCFAYPLAANIYDYFHQSASVEQAKSEWAGLSEAEVNADLELARRYNAQLAASVQMSGVAPAENSAGGSGMETRVAAPGEVIAKPEEEIGEPEEPLGADEGGGASSVGEHGAWDGGVVRYDDVFRHMPIFASLRAPSIGINGLPVYKGVTDEVLWQGVGHLPNTSFPVGGASTHSLLTAHSGLIGKELFTNLEKIKEGDVFEIDVLGKTLSYRVVDVKRILPTDTDAIGIEPGRDLCSLLTCVPVGINTHRLLVTGERFEPVEPIADQGGGWVRPLLSGLALLALALLILLILFPTSRCKVRIVGDDGNRPAPPAGDDENPPAPPADEHHEGEGHFATDYLEPGGAVAGVLVGSTFIEGRLKIALRVGDRILVRRRGKLRDEEVDRKLYGRVTRIFELDGSGIGCEAEQVKRGRPIRFEVVGIDDERWYDDAPVLVRRQWTLSAMMALPLSFALPFVFMIVLPRIALPVSALGSSGPANSAAPPPEALPLPKDFLDIAFWAVLGALSIAVFLRGRIGRKNRR